MKSQLLCLLLIVAGPALAAAWELVLASHENDDTFKYYSEVWTRGEPFNTDDTTDSKNALFPAYTTTYVERIRIQMDATKDGSCGSDCTFTFALPEAYRGKYTLQQLVTMDGGLELIDEQRGSWVTKKNNYFKFDKKETSDNYSYQYYCNAMGLNYQAFPERVHRYPFGAFGRIGVALSSATPCRYFHATEGIGLTSLARRYAYSDLGSGRVVYYKQNQFKSAKVWVIGSQDPIPVERNFTQLSFENRNTFPALRYKYPENIGPGDDAYSYTMMVKLLRSERYTNLFFRHGDVGASRSPSLYFYSDNPGRMDSSSQLLNGRHLYTCMSTGHATCEQFRGYGWLTFGKWHQLAVVGDDNHAAFFIDGEIVRVLPFYNFRTRYEEDQTALVADNFHSAAELSEVRYFNERLTRPEIKTIYDEWLSVREVCGDGSRSRTEDCDDGNLLDGDGCSSDCTIEEGYACFGSNSTTSRPDTCQEGEYVTIIDFEDPAVIRKTEVWTQEYDVTMKGFDGWSMQSTRGSVLSNLAKGSDSLDAAIFSCGDTPMIGGYGICGKDCKLYKSYDSLPAHNFVRLEIELHWLDSWDAEWLYVYADEVPVLAQKKQHRYPAASSSLTDVRKICGGSWNDDYGLLEISFYHHKDTLDLRITSSLSHNPSDESWGIQSIKVTAGEQAPFVLETGDTGSYTIGTQYGRGYNGTSTGVSLLQSGFVRRYHKFGSSYSSLIMEVPGVLSYRTMIEFWMKIPQRPSAYRGVYLDIIRTDSEAKKSDFGYIRPDTCTTRNECTSKRYYRICYHSVHEPTSYAARPLAYCDERQDLNWNTWIHESVDLFDKMRFKYGMTEGNKKSHFALKFTTRADYHGIERISEVLLDDIKVMTMDSGKDNCDAIELSADKHSSLAKVGTVQYNAVGNGWNVLLLEPETHKTIGEVQAMTSTDLTTFVHGLSYGELFAVFTKGHPLTCDDACQGALARAGLSYPFAASGSVDASFVGIGMMGTVVRSMPSRGELWQPAPAARAVVRSMVGCHSYKVSVAENSLFLTSLGQTETSTERVKHELEPTSSGYMGCYRWRGTSGLVRCFSPTRYYTSYGMCSQCCIGMGYAYAQLRYHYYCYCTDQERQRSGINEEFDQQTCHYRCYNDRRTTCGGRDTYYNSHTYSVFKTTGATRYPPSSISPWCSSVHSGRYPCSRLADDNEGAVYISGNTDTLTLELTTDEPILLESIRIYWNSYKTYMAEEWKISYEDLGTGEWKILSEEPDVWGRTRISNRRDVIPMSPLGTKVQKLQFKFTSSSAQQFRIREIFLNAYEHPEDIESHVALREPTTSWNTLIDPAYYYDQVIRAPLPHMKPWEFFNVDNITGIVRLTYGLLDYEAQPYYLLRATAMDDWLDTAITMSVESNNFVEIEHGLGYLPFNVIVRVNATDGPNKYFNFPGMGSVAVDGSEVKEKYGGVLFAYDERRIRLWAPSDVTYGYVVNVNDGWAADYLQSSRSASVRIQVRSGSSADFDSGWEDMKSQSKHAQRDFEHGLGDLTVDVVKVLYRSTDESSPNYGFVFEGQGAALADDDGGSYGGVLFTYSETTVRVMLPNGLDTSEDNCNDGYQMLPPKTCVACRYPCTHRDGSAIFIPKGYGGGMYQEQSHQVQVRVLVWKTGRIAPLSWSAGWKTMTANGVSFYGMSFNMHETPSRIKAVVRPSTDPGWLFEGVGAAQGSDARERQYAGAIFSYSINTVRIWAPAKSGDEYTHAFQKLVATTDGWGDGSFQVSDSQGDVMVLVWRRDPVDMRDTRTIRVNVIDIDEPPIITGATVMVSELEPVGYYVTTISAVDPEGKDVSDFWLVDGNIDNTFDVTSKGVVTLVKLLDYDIREVYTLTVEASDGLRKERAIVRVLVVDGNRPPVVHPPFTREVYENAAAESLVGDPLNGTDPDPTQSVLFYMLPEGNLEDAFMIAACGGQIRVNNPDALDYEEIDGYKFFMLNIMVTDDGENAQNITVNINITVLNANDRPYWADEPEIAVEENSPIGLAIEPPLTELCYDVDIYDELTFSVLGITSTEMEDAESEDVPDPVVYTEANGTSPYLFVGALIDFETTPTYTLRIRCTDHNPVLELLPKNLHSDAAITLTVIDVNDPPECQGAVTQYIPENALAGTMLTGTVLQVSDQDVHDNWSMEMHTHTALFSSSSSGYLVSDAVFNYESRQSYAVAMAVSDEAILTNGTIGIPMTTYCNITVSVLDVNEAPTIADASVIVAENSPDLFLAILNASDPDVFSNQELTFSIVDGSPAGASDQVHVVNHAGRDIAEVWLTTPANYEKYPSFTLHTRVMDNGGDPGLTADGLLFVEVLDRNDPPTLDCSDPCELYVDENSVAGTAVGALIGVDEDDDEVNFKMLEGCSSEFKQRFSLSEDWVLEVRDPLAATLDFEDAAMFSCEMEIYDENELEPGPGSNTFTVVIHLNDVNEPPVIANIEDLYFAIGEGSDLNSMIGLPLAQFASDEDGDELTFTTTGPATWHRMDDDSTTEITNPFSIDEETGQLSLEAEVEAKVDDTITITIAVSDGEHLISYTVEVTITSSNDPPVLTPGQRCKIEENLKGPRFICTLVAEDEQGDDIRFFLGGVSEDFAVQESGELWLNTGRIFNYETTNEYQLNVIVSDNRARDSLSSQGSVAIDVLDVNDPPVVALSYTGSVIENEPIGTVVIFTGNASVLSFSDEDGDQLSCSLENTASFEAVAAGSDEPQSCLIRTKVELDHEAQQQHTFTLHVSDGKEAVKSTVWVDIIDINESPVMSDVYRFIRENSVNGTFAELEDVSAIVVHDDDKDHLHFNVTGGDNFGIFALETFGKTSFGVYVVQDTRMGTFSLDFEDTTEYNLTVVATETDTDEQYSTTFVLTVYVTNVNDVSISNVVHSDTSLKDSFSPSGGDEVEIKGTNFGSVHQSTAVRATYGPFGTEYTATDCRVMNGDNTLITCITAAGVGLEHVWTVIIDSAVYSFDSAITTDSQLFTSYLRPTIADLSMGATVVRTSGGDTFDVSGQGFGAAATEPSDALYQFQGYVHAQALGGGLWTLTDPVEPGMHPCRAALSAYVASVGDVIKLQAVGCAESPNPLSVTMQGSQTMSGGVASVQNFAEELCSFDKLDETWNTADEGGSSVDWLLEGSSLRLPGAQAVVSANSATSSVLSSCESSLWRMYMKADRPGAYLSNYEFVAGNETLDYAEGVALGGVSCHWIATAEDIVCDMPPGVGLGYSVRIIIAGSLSDLRSEPTLSYHEPVIVKVNTSSGGALDTRGYTVATTDSLVSVYGMFFGSDVAFQDYGKGRVQYGPNLTASCSIKHESMYQMLYRSVLCDVALMECEPMAGIGAAHHWNVSVGGQVSEMSEGTTSYKPPVVQDMPDYQWPFSDTAGGDLVTIFGDQFGPAGVAATELDAEYGSAEQWSSDLPWQVQVGSCFVAVPHTSIVCRVGEGTGSNHSWELIVGEQRSNRFDAHSSYTAPLLTQFEVANASSGEVPDIHSFATRGEQYVELLGRNFGPKHRLGLFSPAIQASAVFMDAGQESLEWSHDDCQVTVAHTAIVCRTVEGVGTFLQWTLQVDNQTNRVPTTSYGEPKLLSIAALGASPGSSFHTAGGEIVEINGTNLGGTEDYIDRLTYGPSGTEYRLIDASASINRCWFVVPHSSLRCYTLPGAGQMHYFTVTVGGQTNVESSSGLGPYFNYTVPHIDSISPAEGVTKGGYSLTMKGSNFGPIGQFVVYFWGRRMNSVVVVDASTLTFTVPSGQGSNHMIRVRHESDSCREECTQSSNSVAFSYRAPVLDRLYVRTFNLTGYMNLTLLGEFNSNPAADGGSFGSAPSFSWREDNGDVTTFNNYVYVFNSVVNETMSLNESSRIPCQISAAFGGYWSHDTIVCIVPRSSGSVLVDVGGERSNVITYTDRSPLVTEVAAGTISGKRPTTGGFTLSVTGQYFGQLPPEILLFLRNTENSTRPYMNLVPCLDLVTVSEEDPDTQISSYTCTAPAGQGRNVAVVVRKGGAGSPSTSEYSQGVGCFPCFSYDPPKFTSYSLSESVVVSRRRLSTTMTAMTADITAAQSFPAVLPTTGAQGFTVYGENFGMSSGFKLWLDGVELSLTSHNTTEATAEIPEGVGWSVDFQLQVANQLVTGSDFVLNFLPPVPRTLVVGTTDGLLNTMGGDSITILGVDFGGALTGEQASPSVALKGVGSGPYVGTVGLSSNSLPLVDWNHTMILLTSTEGAGQNHALMVVSADQTGTIQGLSYSPPTIAGISPTHARSSGLNDFGQQVQMTLTGSNFGPTGTARTVHVDDAEVVSFVDEGHGELVFDLPSGQGANVSVYVEVDGQMSNVVNFTYAPPLLLGIDPTIGPTDACNSWETLQSFMNRLSANPGAMRQCLDKVYVTLNGESFGTSRMKVQVGEEICDRSNGETTPGNWDCFDCNAGDCYQDDTEIVVRAPTAFGVNNSVYLWVEGRRDPLSAVLMYDYEPPEISFSSPGSVSQGYGYYDAQGAQLTISGKNFGGEASAVEIFLDDNECVDGQWHAGSFSVGDGFPYLTCTSPVDGVGAKNGTVTVADQTISTVIRAVPDYSVFSSICFASYNSRGEQTDYYGVAAYRDYCAECPYGSLCVSGTNDKDPIAAEGHWRAYLSVTSSRAKERCDKLRFPPYTTRTECPDFLGCVPSQACLGNNECKKGYEYVMELCEDKRGKTGYDNYCESDNDCTGGVEICDRRNPEKCSFCNKLPSEQAGNCTCTPAPRCSMCTIYEYYKISGECRPCPQNVWLLIALFIGGIVAFIWIGYYLNKKKFNLAFMSIGFDYFQVLAIFANTKIAWPNVVVDFMKISLFFSFDINLTAPECVMPDISYEMKWFATMLLPIAAGVCLLLAFWYKLGYKSFVQGKRGWKKLSSHGNALVALYVLMLYYLYLPLIVKALDVMNCNPAIPDDGNQYTDWTSANCEGGMCVCWVSGGVQMQLVPYAVLALLLYGVGFPLVVTYIIMKHRIVIKEDQLLRAMGTGGTRATNPEGYEIRKRYHKMYYHFKPGKIYWLLLVLTRKFWVALAALMFKDNPIFQLAFILLVLFVAYVLQVKHRPFMSSAEREAELEKLANKYKETADHDLSSEERRKYQRIHQALEAIRRKEEVEGLRRKKVGLSGEGSEGQFNVAASYFWDYNTVELYLLACSIFVCVAGIMFESDTYRNRANLGMHLYVLTFLVCVVVSTSLLYYAVVFYSEVAVGLGYDPMGWVGKYFMSKSKNVNTDDVNDDDFAMFSVAKGKDGLNPMNERDEKAEFEKEKYVADLAEENQKLMDRINDLKKQQQLMSLQNAKGGKGGGARLKKKKTVINDALPGDDDTL